MEIVRGMEVKITGVIHRLIFLKKFFLFFLNFFFFWGGGIFVQIIGGHGPPCPPPYFYGPGTPLCPLFRKSRYSAYYGCSKNYIVSFLLYIDLVFCFFAHEQNERKSIFKSGDSRNV